MSYIVTNQPDEMEALRPNNSMFYEPPKGLSQKYPTIAKKLQYF
jgi:hypothetical protein